MRYAVGFVLLAACSDDYILPAEEAPPIDTATACAVPADIEAIFLANCDNCHIGGGLGGVHLDGDAQANLLDAGLVVAGDPEGSVLYERVAGLSGGIMPPSGAMDAASVEAIRAWIADGAALDCP
jgi:mono/diheme cytochrome c family protein